MFVHLLSNASAGTFPDNTLADFSTILSKPLVFDGTYEVTLTEIHIPNTLNILTKEQDWIEWVQYARELSTPETVPNLAELESRFEKYKCRIKLVAGERYEVTAPDGVLIALGKAQCGLPSVIYGNSNRVFVGEAFESSETLQGPITIISAKIVVERVKLTKNFYGTGEKLLEFLTRNATAFFSLDFLDGYVRCVLKKQSGCLRFSTHLSNVLGFRERSIQQKEAIADHLPDAFPGLNFFNVFTNFIESSHLGDVQAPLLRSLPVQHGVEHNHIMTYQCQTLQYKKVLRRELECIRILITDDTGKPPNFSDRGRVGLTLHFRRRN